MYPNLEGELRKRNITRQKMAHDLNWNIATVSQKLNKKDRLKLNEAYSIRDKYCPDVTIEYLFKWLDSTA